MFCFDPFRLELFAALLFSATNLNECSLTPGRQCELRMLLITLNLRKFADKRKTRKTFVKLIFV